VALEAPAGRSAGDAGNAVPRPGTPARLAHLYREHVVRPQREQRFVVAAAFLITILVVRFITHSIRDRRFTWLFHNVGSGGTHVHHLVFGIIGMLVVGYVSTAFHPERRWLRNVLAGLWGVCAALTMDEFALWLTLKDVYWTSEGKASVDAIILVGSIISFAAAGRGLLIAMARDVGLLLRDATGRH
jgi:hypothetical protein